MVLLSVGLLAALNRSTATDPILQTTPASSVKAVASTDAGFEPNHGQITNDNGELVPHVLYRLPAGSITLYLTQTGLTMVHQQREAEHHHEQGKHEHSPLKYTRVDATLVGANIQPNQVREALPCKQYNNYYYSHCPQGITNVQSFRELTFPNVYPGIDWVWHVSPEGGIKYDFIVHPEANPRQIGLRYEGASLHPEMQSSMLRIETALGSITEGQLKSFNGGQPVESYYRVHGNSVGFAVEQYDTELPLIIDPPLANLWGTYFGSTAHDKNTDVRGDVNAQGELYITTNARSPNFPVLNPGGIAYFDDVLANIGAYRGGDVVLLKFDNTGELLWCTYVGGGFNPGPGHDAGMDIACDAAGRVWLTGYSANGNFPTMSAPGAYNDSTWGGPTTGTTMGGGDAILLRFSAAGAMEWSTYLGGSDHEWGLTIDIDPNGNAWLAGRTQSIDFPVLDRGAGAWFQDTLGGIFQDAFLAKFSADGALLHATYFGGSMHDHIERLVCAADSTVYFAGTTRSSDLPLVQGDSTAWFQSTFAGEGDPFDFRYDRGDVFVGRLNQQAGMEWVSYLGGTEAEVARGIALTPAGNLYVTGSTESSDFPLLDGGGYFQMFAGRADVFLTRFSADGELLHSTMIGDSDDDLAGDVAIDACGNVFVTGHTDSEDFPTLDPGNGAYFVGYRVAFDDLFYCQLDSSNNLVWSTYSGSAGFDEKGTDLVIGPNQEIFATGYWCFYSVSNACLDPGGGSYYKENIDGDDYFVMKLEGYPVPPMTSQVSAVGATCHGSCDGIALAVGAAQCHAPYTYLWSNGHTTAMAEGLCAGTYTVTVTGILGDTMVLTTSVPDGPMMSVQVSYGTDTIMQGDSTMLTATTATNWMWSHGDSTQATTVGPDSTTTYTVLATDASGCTATDSVTIVVEYPLPPDPEPEPPSSPLPPGSPAAPQDQLQVPNVFTPNGDQLNDEFVVQHEGYTNLELRIYNRWGELLQHSVPGQPRWNGRDFAGMPCAAGTYFWVLTGTGPNDQPHQSKGTLTLLR